MAQFSCNQLNCTYQIVCYEGSNIIEVHVKNRNVCSSWNGGHGVIGIQNATGVNQVYDPSNTATLSQVQGKPPAFYPQGYNTSTSTFNNVAFRFTPQGNTPYALLWYRLTAAGDSIPLSTTPGDPNGWYEPMNQYDPLHPRLTRAHVSPSEPTRYVAYLYFLNAEGEKYRLRDTIFVGVDDVEALDAKIYANNGQIVVEGADGNKVVLYDVTGRILATKVDEYAPLRFDIPVSGTYLVKIGNHAARRIVMIR
jgi:hypothetical protein